MTWYTDPSKDFATKCCGQVQYFVKVMPKEQHLEKIRSLGLPDEAQRFAMVKSFAVRNVTHGLMDTLTEGGSSDWVKKVRSECVRMGVCEDVRQWKKWLKVVERFAQLWAADWDGSRVVLRHPHKPHWGRLELQAVPVSGNCTKWFSETKGPVRADGMLRIDPSKAIVEGIHSTARSPVAQAETQRKRVFMYFTDTYNRSGSSYHEDA